MSQPEIAPSTKLRLDRKLTRPGRQSVSALLILTTISVSNVNVSITSALGGKILVPRTT